MQPADSNSERRFIATGTRGDIFLPAYFVDHTPSSAATSVRLDRILKEELGLEGDKMNEKPLPTLSEGLSPQEEPVQWIGKKRNFLRRVLRERWERSLKKDGVVKKWRARWKKGKWKVKQKVKGSRHGPVVDKGVVKAKDGPGEG